MKTDGQIDSSFSSMTDSLTDRSAVRAGGFKWLNERTKESKVEIDLLYVASRKTNEREWVMCLSFVACLNCVGPKCSLIFQLQQSTHGLMRKKYKGAMFCSWSFAARRRGPGAVSFEYKHPIFVIYLRPLVINYEQVIGASIVHRRRISTDH